MGTPSGRKLRDFYSQTDKQVREVHNEARRLADLKAGKGEAETEATSAAPAASATPAAPAGAETANVAPAATPTAQPAGATAPADQKA